MSNHLYLETTIHGYTCPANAAKPWWATVSGGDGPALGSPKPDIQDSGFRVRRCHFLSSIVSDFSISAFQCFPLRPVARWSRSPAVSSSHPRFPLSGFSVSAFPLGPTVPFQLSE